MLDDTMRELQQACDEFGMSLESALREKALELRIRFLIKCMPDARLKEQEIAGFLQEVTGARATEQLVNSVILRVRGPRLSEEEVIALEIRQNGRCAVCGKILNDAARMHVDHVVPVAFGGHSQISNYQLLCLQCNLGKGKLLSWLMGSPFFADAEDTISARLRFCVLSYFGGICSHHECERSSRTAEMDVAPRIPRSRGGRLIFDNLLAYCREHADFLRREEYERAKRALMQQRRGLVTRRWVAH